MYDNISPFLFKILCIMSSIYFAAEITTVKGHVSHVNQALLRFTNPCKLEDGYFACKDGSACVGLEMVCNGKPDCQDSSDETGRCRDECTAAGLTCSQMCRRTPHGPRCACSRGQQMAKDNVTCIDIDECSFWPPVCSQLCNNTSPGHRCACADGYKMADDMVHCQTVDGKFAKAYLVYTQGRTIMKTTVGHGHDQPSRVHTAKGDITAIAMDTREERVFWFDNVERMIKSVGLNGENVQNVIVNGLGTVSGIDLDWIGRNLYFTDYALHRVVVCSLISVQCTVIRDLHEVSQPRSIAVDSINRKLYWSDCGVNHRIEVTSLDGSNVKVLVDEQVRCATSLRIDLPLQTLYWTDPDLHLIESVKTDGSSRRNITSRFIRNPTGVSVFEEELYWSNTFEDVVSHAGDQGVVIAGANKFSLHDAHPVAAVEGLKSEVAELHFFHTVLQFQSQSGTSECSADSCSDICLLMERNTYKCACPLGKQLDIRKHTCEEAWTLPTLLVARNNHLLRVTPDVVAGQTFETLMVNGGHNITALAVDWATQTVYFGDSYRAPGGSGGTKNNHGSHIGTIAKFRLNDPSKVDTLFEDASLISSIAVDWIAKNIYWVDYGREVIEMARLDGVSRMVLLGGKRTAYIPQTPRAVAVDPINAHLYYSDCGSSSHIGLCNLADDCVTTAFRVPVGCVSSILVDQLEKRVYWADTKLSMITSASLDGKDVKPIRHSLEPLSIALTADRIFWTDVRFMDILYNRKAYSDHREAIMMSISPLGALLAIDKDTQPDDINGCSISNGGCSNLCIAAAHMKHVCMCPPSRYLGNDQRTCLSADDVDQDVSNVVPGARSKPPPVRSTSARRRLSTTRPSNGCPEGRCLNGGECIVMRYALFCSCPPGTSGSRCEHRIGQAVLRPGGATPSSLTDAQSTVGQAWIAGVLTALAVLAVTVLLIVCYLRKRSRLRPGELFGFVQFKTVLFGRRDEDDEQHKKALVNPSYENPGYVEIDDDMINCNKASGGMMVVAPSVESIDSAYVSRRDYPYTKHVDTSDP